jgi:protein-L-isoaspartate O-methyltransferase
LSWDFDAPYNKIISAAAFNIVEDELISLLSPGGVLLIPTAENCILRIKKQINGKMKKEIFPGYIFVPLL